ncbi:beta-N-acetylhexosaminidase [Woodsholea maritima]|uniref:beta-N-acetylhexosaminidase n=1 Tax=Woodsholea maritima TaxID=240237 RepID=UPI00036EF2F6|nr:family 20 glycosylhydrolase [Woodsholea maritima]
MTIQRPHVSLSHLSKTALLGLGLVGALALSACSREVVPDRAAEGDVVAVIPAPRHVVDEQGTFQVRPVTPLAYGAGDEAAGRVADQLSEWVRMSTGRGLPTHAFHGQAPYGAIQLHLDPAQDIAAEGYRLAIRPGGIEILASDEAGLFYGAVTLWQLMADWGAEPLLSLETVTIEDAPEFPWRGVMLDSARHMQSVGYIKDFIDWMALHKLNTLHWHLTDDQGWRLEIAQYPRLTEVGAFRVPAGQAYDPEHNPDIQEAPIYGGYYTQDQVRDIIAYAAARHITIVPEIDIPGHALAAVVAYPELASVDNPPSAVMADWGVYPYLFNVNEDTFTFLENVFSEVIELFPSPYIHVGGDEPPKDQWEASPEVQARMAELGIANEHDMQGYVTRRLDEFLTAHGRTLVGWDEIVEGGLSDNATVMSWRGLEGAKAAADQGKNAILSPNSHLYLDYRQANGAHETPGRGRLTTLRQLYEFDPFGGDLTQDQRKHILGVQANIWTEHMRQETDVTHMAFPRISALAELGWSAPESRNFDGFMTRLSRFKSRYREMGLDYADSAVRPLADIRFDAQGQPDQIQLSNQAGFGDIRYSWQGRPTPSSSLATGPIVVDRPGRLRAATFDGDRRLSDIVDFEVTRNARYARRDDQLTMCADDLVIYLVDDAPIHGPRANFGVNIMDPCWIWPEAPVNEASSITVTVGQVPYNFQLMHDIHNVVVRPLLDDRQALRVLAGGCEGEEIARLDLAPAQDNLTLTDLRADLATSAGPSDLCFVFHTGQLDPLWVIDAVRLNP